MQCATSSIISVVKNSSMRAESVILSDITRNNKFASKYKEMPLTLYLMDDVVRWLVLGNRESISRLLELCRVVVEVEYRHADVDTCRQRIRTAVGTHDHHVRAGFDLVIQHSSGGQFVLTTGQLVLTTRLQLAQLERGRRRLAFQPTRHLYSKRKVRLHYSAL